MIILGEKVKSVICCLLLLSLAGCVRVAGGAEVYRQCGCDEKPKVKQVGFDTANLTHRDKAE